jgi:hypothetical protein
MNEDSNQLSETFAAHEHLAPDAGDVLAKAKRIARTYHRRRWAVRATGGAVLSAGLVAGGIALPGRVGHANTTQAVGFASGADASPSASPSPATYTQAQELAAYFAAGYDYNDAVQLAQLWNDSGDINHVKATAGLDLLEGQTLAVKPSGTPESPINKDVSAFFAAGYTYDDAVSLSNLWHNSSYQAKVEGGKMLLDNQPLPIPPSGPADPNAGSTSAHLITGARAAAMAKAFRAAKGKVVLTPKAGKDQVLGSSADGTAADQARAAYFAAGYDYNDAVALGTLWHESDPWQVKADAGQKLIDGQTLPIAPGSSPNPPAPPVTQTDTDVNAFFAAGYTYDDAVTLGNLWNNTNTYQVKAEAGKKLLDGQTLPIAP